MTTFDSTDVMAGLKGFQRRTVDHVVDRFFGADPSARFLVSDETGLGKSLVARGVIARTVERLQHEPGRRQVNIVYVCSNTDLAAQNLKRLDVTSKPHTTMPSRLSLLAKYSRELQPVSDLGEVAVNLVSFTPGTSFSHGQQSGQAEERALLFLLLSVGIDLSGWNRHAALVLLQGSVGSKDRFEQRVDQLDQELNGTPEATIADTFLASSKQAGHLAEFTALLDELGRRRTVPGELQPRVKQLIGQLRGGLARAGLSVLAPDLVILDEFQRFPELLDATDGPGLLADQLFSYPGTKVLLLSATPYKPFTYAEESGEDHHTDFVRTLRFLDPDVAEAVADDLTAYRAAATRGEPAGELVGRLRGRLLRVMSRSERPAAVAGGMLSEHVATVDDLHPSDLVDYVRLRALSDLVSGEISLDYWKSTPYFANFCEGYKLAAQLKGRLKGPDRATVAPAVAALTRLDRSSASGYGDVELANGKLRALAATTVDAGWWKLLWLPPSLPYLEPTGPYAESWVHGMTKRLVFSSWAATPTAIAGLLSQRAARKVAQGSERATPEVTSRADVRSLLDYRLDGGRPASMTTLALFWPMPGLAAQADPLSAAGSAGVPVDRRAVETSIVRALRRGVDKYALVPIADAARIAFAVADSLPPGLVDDRPVLLQRLSAATTDTAEGGARGLSAHVDEALRLRAEGSDTQTASVAPTLAALALSSPGNIAWRALRRVFHGQGAGADRALWESAAVLAAGLRSLFNRPESIMLLEKLDTEDAYWQKVLRYCAAGNLEAVLDEYLHHLSSQTPDVLTGASLLALATKAAEAISLRPSVYSAFDPANPDDGIPLRSRFALRYGGARTTEGARQPEVREAFNSPFWPFVLASTSVGQEGIDFHWWCSAIVHWNTPANPVDFEQREGRINRYGGHAVRRNLAHRHGAAMLRSADPWLTAYELGTDEQANLGEFAPHWVYPGPATIERHLSPYPLSVDVARLERLKIDLALYRLTFGQPRQEDMLELLRKRGVGAQPERMAELRIDLSAP